MNNLYLKYIAVAKDKYGDHFCSGNGVNYLLNFRHIVEEKTFDEIKNIYNFFKREFKLFFRSLEVVNLENISTEREFENYNFDPSHNGSLFFKFDIPMMWVDNENQEFAEILLPKGCELRFYKNNMLEFPLMAVIGFNFNLFSNSLVSLDTIGTYSPSLYYFKDGARLNRAIIRNAILGLKLKYPQVEIEFSNEIGWLSNFDEFGFTEETDYVFD